MYGKLQPWRGLQRKPLGVSRPATAADANAYMPPPLVEPVIWRPKQRGYVDIFTNVAVIAAAAIVIRDPLYVNQPWKKWHQFDQTTNYAVRTTATPAQIATPVDQQATRPRWQQPEISPNLAAQIAAPASQVLCYADPLPWKARPQQPDIAPNLAAPSQQSFQRVLAEPPTTRIKVQPPDLSPNLAINVQVAAQLNASPEPILSRRYQQQIDLHPNLAITAQVNYLSTWIEVAQPARKWPLLDCYPNIAVNVLAQAPRVVPTPVEPIFTPRYSPQVDVYRDNAVHVATQAPYVPPLPIEPQLAIRYAPQVVEFPNLVISVPYTAPIVPPDVTQQPAGRKTRRRLEVEIDGQVFPVESVDEAYALLDRAREMATQRAEIVADEVVRRKLADKPPVNKPIRVPVPQLHTDNQELVEIVIRTRHAIARIYREQAMLAEIRLRMEQDDDDEDAILLLL